MTETHEKNHIESLIKSLSIAYILLLICGLLYNYFFYKNFGITITEYIDISDALLLFIPLLADTLVQTIFITVTFHYILKSFLSEKYKLTLFGDNIKKVMLKASLIGISILFIILILYLFNDVFKIYFFMSLLVVVVFFIPFLLDKFFNSLNIDLSASLKELLYLTIIVLAIVILKSETRSKLVNNKRNSKDFTIIFKDQNQILKSDSSLYYLGRTKNFVFIYDFKNHNSRVYNVSDIKEFITSK